MTGYDGYEQVEGEVADGVLTIWLSRPNVLNAFTGQMKDELCDILDRAEADDGVRAVVVTGRGRGFCAGADISEGGERFGLAGGARRKEEHQDRGGIVALRLFEFRKPTIAAINGPAFGVGITMTLPMDVRLMARGAHAGFVFARRGIVPDACSSWFLPRIVGISRAAEWCYSGRPVDADEALRAGLVRDVHEPADLLPAARALARSLVADSAPVAVAVTRRMLWQMLGAGSPFDAHVVGSRAIYELGRSADADEGIQAFRERRAPEFPLRVSRDLPAI